jgi:carbonic anhydrase
MKPRALTALSLASSLAFLGCSVSEAAEKRSSQEGAASASSSASAHGEASGYASAEAAGSAAPAHGHKDHPWTYTGDKGPESWGELDPKWEQCAHGKSQSPVDLPSIGDEPRGALDKLSVDYMSIPLRVKNNGHTVEVQNRTDSFVMVGSKRFDLVQFHFHSPSEHTIAGQRYPLEVHFVNKARDGELAVVGVLFESGDPNKALEEIWKKMPKSETQDYVNHEKKLLNVSEVISLSEGYYHYPGSLTTPPCSEGVRWFVMKETQEIEQRAVDQFRNVLGGRSNRPVQPVGDRKVFFIEL